MLCYAKYLNICIKWAIISLVSIANKYQSLKIFHKSQNHPEKSPHTLIASTRKGNKKLILIKIANKYLTLRLMKEVGRKIFK